MTETLKSRTGKLCTRCNLYVPKRDFPKCSQYPDGYRPWCRPCYREYQREYHKQYKYQPKLDEMMKAIDREPRSDMAIEKRNRALHKERRHRNQECAYPGCITRLNFLQDRLCMRHEREMVEAKMARKLRLGK